MRKNKKPTIKLVIVGYSTLYYTLIYSISELIKSSLAAMA